jgi:hypothetical protein
MKKHWQLAPNNEDGRDFFNLCANVTPQRLSARLVQDCNRTMLESYWRIVKLIVRRMHAYDICPLIGHWLYIIVFFYPRGDEVCQVFEILNRLLECYAQIGLCQ